MNTKKSHSNVYISVHYVWTCINICILHSSVQTYRHRSTFRRQHEDRMRRTSIANRLPQGCMCLYVSTSINFQKHYQVWDPSDMNRLFYQSKLGSNKLAWYNTLPHNLKYSYKVPYKVQSICSPNLLAFCESNSSSTRGAMASKSSNAENDAAKVATLTEEVPHGTDRHGSEPWDLPRYRGWILKNGFYERINGHNTGYVRGYPPKIWPYMVQYLHFRILEFPLNEWDLPVPGTVRPVTSCFRFCGAPQHELVKTLVSSTGTGAPLFADHRASRAGHAKTANILRSNLKAVKMILAARKVDVADGSAEQAAINKEIAGMGAEKLTASHACGIFASMREETFFRGTDESTSSLYVTSPVRFRRRGMIWVLISLQWDNIYSDDYK